MKKLAIASICCILSASAVSAQTYRDISATPEDRARSIVAEMTLQEKVSLMQHESPAIPRLGIRQYNWWNEALHGVGRAGLATVFPQPIGMAATFDDRLVFDIFSAVSDEARAKHHHAKAQGPLRIYQGLTFWTPNVNLFRDPRWGRGHETYGEDPYLTSRMGVSVVRGLQGDNYDGGALGLTRYNKLHACAKHYAVHNGPEWSRHSFNAKGISPRDLWESYLPAFKALVQEAEVKEVMCAYNRVDDEPCCGNNRLLNTILRDGWGYQGIILTDCWAMNDFFTPGHHNTDPSPESAVAKAVRTGTDLECGNSYPALVQAVEQGLISEKEIDRSVTRLMKARFELGEMDPDSIVPWALIPYDVVDCNDHRKLAHEAALRSLVLLKNDGVLPLKPGIKVGLIGPNANDSVMQWGNYNGFPAATSTLYSALRERIGDANLIYVPGIDHTSDKSIQSLIGYTSANGRQGWHAEFWNKFSDMAQGKNPDVYYHYSQPLALTTAGATVWAPGVNLGGFGATFSTTFKPEKTENVIFTLQDQGYMDLWIDGERVFHGGNLKSANAYTLHAVAGKAYDIKVTFHASEGDCASLYFDFGRSEALDLDKTTAALVDCDVIIFAGGLSPQLEGEEMPISIPGFRGGDRDIIELPAIQTRLLEKLRSLGRPVVYVNFSGSAVGLEREEPLANAILQAWYPGQDGGRAITETLFGDFNPCGKLPVTFYRSTADLADIEDYDMSHGRTYRYFKGSPLYPFGHGLSYTTFSFGQASIVRGQDDNITLKVPVTNTGSAFGTETVQVYISRPADTAGPARQLRAFRQVKLWPGDTQVVDIELSPESFAWFDETTSQMRPLPGEYIISYGSSSDPQSLSQIHFTR